MTQTNPYQKYQQQSIMTMTPGERLTKLYDETIKHLSAALLAMEEGQYDKVNESTQKAQRIINYLRATLDFQYDISNSLASLYDYFISRIVEANIKKDSGPLNEILPMVSELRETFIQADRLARVG